MTRQTIVFVVIARPTVPAELQLAQVWRAAPKVHVDKVVERHAGVRARPWLRIRALAY